MGRFSNEKASLEALDKFGEDRRIISSSRGNISVRIIKEGQPDEVLKTNWLNFYIEDWRSVIEAYFGEDTGHNRVPAVSLTAGYPLTVGKHEISHPFEPDWKVAAIFGEGRPNGGIGGEAFGKGVLEVSSVTVGEEAQRIEAVFQFIYVEASGDIVKVVSEPFSIENDGL